MNCRFAQLTLPEKGALALAVGKEGTLTALGREIDGKMSGRLKKVMTAESFDGTAEKTLTLTAPEGLRLSRLVLVGTGDEAFSPLSAEKFGAAAAEALKGGADPVHLAVEAEAEMAAHAALGAVLKAYRFTRYQSEETRKDEKILSDLVVLTDEPGAAEKAFAPQKAVAEGVVFARDLVTEPANVMTPEKFAAELEDLVNLGVEVEILDEAALEKIGMRMLLAVNQGSAAAPRVAVMRWRGRMADTVDLGLAGKGVCFDSGGISIKPSAGMEDMKFDMGGAAAVAGAMKALAGRKAEADVVGIVGLVENMPSGTAQRPGDVVRSLSGKTVEVINTDAEGRMVLGDVLCYLQETFNPRYVVDLATLTGAIIVALGHEHAGLFSNCDSLAEGLSSAGRETAEPLWRFPMNKKYDELLKSDIADMKNIGGREAGSITAAQFLKRFIREGTEWAHIDIAGMAWTKKDKPLVPKGAAGFGVRLLDACVAQMLEKE